MKRRDYGLAAKRLFEEMTKGLLRVDLHEEIMAILGPSSHGRGRHEWV